MRQEEKENQMDCEFENFGFLSQNNETSKYIEFIPGCFFFSF